MLVWPAGCRPKPVSQDQTDPITTQTHADSVIGVPLEMIDIVDLQVQWTVPDMLLARDAKIEKACYFKGRLYLLDTKNNLHALDGRKGVWLWTTSLGDEAPHCSQPVFYQNHLILVLGKKIIEVRDSDGMITHTIDLAFSPTTSAARLGQTVFVGGNDSRFYSIRYKDGMVFWHSVQPDDPIGNVVIEDNRVYFVCKNGTLYVSSTAERRLEWSAATKGQTPGITIDNNRCYLPSSDTSLYCYKADSGDLIWKYLAGGPLEEVPVLTNNFIYQYVSQYSLLALDRNGQLSIGSGGLPTPPLRWQLQNGFCLLAENGPVSYVITLDKQLTVMDNINGKKLKSFYVPNFDVYVSNPEDEMIFLANQDGAILALSPKKKLQL
ncbi:MAG: PQQ-like beta-propeller repeat protein [Sedimentisphaerales bacterium]|nr:PQQ-like beta-propeller repeat protein [Sedimentisphaerales bacterium]